MPLTNRIICSLLFRPTVPGMYSCNSCGREYRSLHGFTDLMNHLRRFHAGYEAEAEAAVRTNNALRLHVVDARTNDIYRWVEWVVVERLPFTFVERRLVCQNARMGTITAKTLSTYVKRKRDAVDQRVSEVLPNKFGFVLDGWTSGSRHYVAIFAVFDDGTRVTGDSDNDYFDDLDYSSRGYLLLAFSPLDEEEDLGTQRLFNLITDTLSHYEKLTPLAPVSRNDTRWSSSFAMVERYYRLEPFLRALDHGQLHRREETFTLV